MSENGDALRKVLKDNEIRGNRQVAEAGLGCRPRRRGGPAVLQQYGQAERVVTVDRPDTQPYDAPRSRFDRARGECGYILPRLFPWESSLPWAPSTLRSGPNGDGSPFEGQGHQSMTPVP
jgi:hypothetical protein